MARCARHTFRPRLLALADRLEAARTLDEFLAAVDDNARVWMALGQCLTADPGLLPREDVAVLRRHARYVLDACDDVKQPHDHHIEAFIAINRRAADMVAAVPLPVRVDVMAAE